MGVGGCFVFFYGRLWLFVAVCGCLDRLFGVIFCYKQVFGQLFRGVLSTHLRHIFLEKKIFYFFGYLIL
jgi:hypothetical protein